MVFQVSIRSKDRLITEVQNLYISYPLLSQDGFKTHPSTSISIILTMDQNTSNIINRLLLFLGIIFMTAVVIIKRRLDRMAVDLRLINHERYMHREPPNRSFTEVVQMDRGLNYTPEQLRERRERQQARRHEE